MIKFDAVAVNKMNSYFATTAYEDLNVVVAYQQVTSGKKKYDYESLLYFLINGALNQLNNGTVNQKKLDKYFKLIGQIGSVDRKDYKFDELSVSTYALIPDAYKKYASGEGKTFDENFYNRIIEIGKSIGVVFEEVKTSDSAAAKIVELDSKVEALTKENEKLRHDLESALKELRKTNSSKTSQTDRFNEEMKSKLERISELEKEIASLSEALRITENNLDQKKLAVVQFENLIKEKDKLIRDVNKRLSQVQDELSKSEDKRNGLMRSDAYILGRTTLEERTIDGLILNILKTCTVTSDAILENVRKENSNYTLRDVLASLKRISTRFAIENASVVSVPKLYGISRCEVPTDKLVKLPIQGNVKKLIFVSDFHIDPLDDPKYIEAKMSSVQEYARSNDINTIINLGDLFNTKDKTLAGETEFDKVMAIFSETTSFLADSKIFDPNIYHLVLGGNHDISITKYGIDPISFLADKIPSIIPIGYNTAKLQLGENKRNIFGLHHGGAPRQDSVSPKEFVNRVACYLDKYYEKNPNGRDTRFDFLGHIHSGVIEPVNGFAVVPSLLRDRVCDGALEANIYFDSKGEIEYMTIFPLICSTYKEVRRAPEIPIVR